MSRPKNPKTAIVCAWRKGETDLSETVKSATGSIFAGAQLITVEDTAAQGPGRTRHRGIEAAADADVIVIIDSHMRFNAATLTSLAWTAWRKGGVCCPQVYHNDQCAFDGTPYAGARIVYRAKDGRAYTALAGKWSRETEPGPRGCVMGGCYAFRRDWYYEVGQPLAALPGWGCDEETLSIASWMSGVTPQCVGVQAAHLYRARPPWPVMSAEYAAVYAGRMALIHAVATESTARRELETWTRDGVPEGVPVCESPEAERFRLALLKLPRKWADWRAQVCEPDELDGVQERAPRPVDTPAHRTPVRQIVTQLPGVRCPHCQSVHDPITLNVAQIYPNANRRHKCPSCGNFFISNFRTTT